MPSLPPNFGICWSLVPTVCRFTKYEALKYVFLLSNFEELQDWWSCVRYSSYLTDCFCVFFHVMDFNDAPFYGECFLAWWPRIATGAFMSNQLPRWLDIILYKIVILCADHVKLWPCHTAPYQKTQHESQTLGKHIKSFLLEKEGKRAWLMDSFSWSKIELDSCILLLSQEKYQNHALEKSSISMSSNLYRWLTSCSTLWPKSLTSYSCVELHAIMILSVLP